VLRNPGMHRLAFLALALAACQSASSTPDDCLAPRPTGGAVVARIGGMPLGTDELVARLLDQGDAALRRYHDEEALRGFVDDQIRFELLVRAALERGMARDPDVVRAAQKVMVRRLLQVDLDASLGAPPVDEAQLATYYAAHSDDYRQPEMRRIAHVQLAPTEEGRAEAQSLNARLLAKPDDAALFHRLVSRYSRDAESAGRGGELAFATQDELVDSYGLTFADRVFGLAPGAFASTPVQSTRGWHLVKLVAVREARVRPLEVVRDEIRDRLLQDARARAFDQYLASIRRRYAVSLEPEALTALRTQLQAATEVQSR